MSLGDSLRDMLAWVDQSISTDAAFVVSVDVRSDILYLVGRFWLLEHLSCTNLLTDLSVTRILLSGSSTQLNSIFRHDH